MGGTVAMIIRKPQGHEPEVQPMLRWTNISKLRSTKRSSKAWACSAGLSTPKR